MADYTCPLCGRKVRRDLALFLNHTNEHVIDAIKKEHPEWVESDGTCQPCAEYYEKELSGEMDTSNLGPHEAKKRFILGIFLIAVSVALGVWFYASGVSQKTRWILFAPLFAGTFCLFEAKLKTCSVLAELGSVNFDSGVTKIEDEEIATKLKYRSRLMVLQAAFVSGAMTFIYFLLPVP